MASLVLPPLWCHQAAAVTYTATDTIDLHPSSLLGSSFFSQANGVSGSQQVGYGLGPNTGSYHALLWSGTAASAIDLHPSLLGSSSFSIAYAVSGSQQVGYGSGSNTSSLGHALLWSGSAASAIDLNPASLLGSSSNSIAYAVSGSQQVGYGSGSNFPNATHALLWSGSAASAIDLNPTVLGSSSQSYATAISGSQQVGYGFGSNTSNIDHALLWSGSAASAIDLNPTFLGSNSQSYANAIYGSQQVGYGSGSNFPNATHALLWSGSAASAIDLNPTLLGSSSSSIATAISGSQQVGYGSGSNTSNFAHALLWSGSAASAIDLHTLLPQGFISSGAQSIDLYGNIAGYGVVSGNSHALEWLAGDLYSIGGTGAWATASNWTAGTPGAGNDVLLLQPDASNRTITYSGNATLTPLGKITLDATGSGTITLSQTSGTLSSTNELIGDFGNGTYIQTGGTHLVSGTLTLAANAGSQGTYTLNNAAAVLNAGTILLNAGGTFNQTAGTLVSSSFYQQGGAVTGTLTNQGNFIYTSGTFSGRLVNYGTVTLNAAFTAGNGIENDGSLTISSANPVTVNGLGLDNFGTLTLGGGILSGSGSVTNDVGGIMSAHGTIAPAFTNYGQLYPTGLLVLGSASSNAGAVYISGGQGLRATSAFSNAGQIILSGGSISGSSAFTNNAGGIIQGSGGVSSPLTNGGGIIVSAGGQIAITPAFTSSGYVQLLGSGASFTGGAITNSGTIKGAGQIASNITNNGVIRPENGELDLGGALANSASAQIQVGAGNTAFITQGLASNLGTIALSGGAFDNNNQPLSNFGSIEGNGIVRTGGLTNASGATILLTDANSSFFGPVTNAANVINGNGPGSIKIVGNTTTFYGPVTNNGTIKVTSGVARFLGNGVSMTVGGTYTSDPSDNYFNGLAITSGGTVSGGGGDRFFLTGGTFTNGGTFSNGGTLAADTVNNSALFMQTGTLVQTGNFTNTGNVTLAGAQSWAPGTHFAQNAGGAAFNSDSGSPSLANLAVDVSGGAVSFNATQHLASLNISNGLAMLHAGGANVLVAASLTISGGQLDVLDNKIITHTPIGSWDGAKYTGIAGLIQSGRNGGNWSGSGIVTSQTQATRSTFTSIGVASASQVKGIAATATATWVGQAVTGSDTLVMYTYGGDANLDGKINVDDYGHIDTSIGIGLAGWFNGDFNYDGKINVDDYGIIDFNIGIQGAPFPTGSSAGAGGAVTAVPEPGIGGAIVVGIVTTGMRRRRRDGSKLNSVRLRVH